MVFKCVAFSKLVVVMLHLAPFLQVLVIVSEEVIVVLGTHCLSALPLPHLLVGLKVGRPVLSQLVVVVLVVKIV